MVDFGTVEIKSEKGLDTDRWIKHPEKEFVTLKLNILSKEAEVKYIKK